jgi:hypothetical protein
MEKRNDRSRHNPDAAACLSLKVKKPFFSGQELPLPPG